MRTERLFIPAPLPFRLDLTAWALRRRKSNIVDRWAGDEYSRVYVDDGRPVMVIVEQPAADIEPQLTVTLHCDHELTDAFRGDVEPLLQRLLGLTVDLRSFYSLADGDDLLKRLIDQFSGVRPPRFPTIFEALVNSIACQQVSLDSGIAALNRLTVRFGVSFSANGVTTYAFPRPVDLSDAPEGSIEELGFSRQKARAIRELARDVAVGCTDLEILEVMANKEVVCYLSNLRGIGRWSAEYVLLRGLGRLDTFPGDDVGAQNNLQRLFHLDTRPSYDEIKELVARWAPYQGFVYFHLLLEKLRSKGLA